MTDFISRSDLRHIAEDLRRNSPKDKDGGVRGHQDYICYGVQDGDNIIDKEDRMDCVTMRKSEKDHSYIEYYYERRIYEDGTYYDRYTKKALYLTDAMLKNLRTSN